MIKAKFLNPKLLLVAIIILFFATRLYKIGEIPVSVYWDEASIGYNAYSIAQTGKDEWGEFLPIHFRAFGEFKLPVYIYSVVPFVKLFGLNAFSVRLPAVLFSLGVVILTYFLAKKITGDKTIGLLSSFFVSISPWFFIFSRTGYEATAGLMFYLLGIYIFLSRSKNYFILLSVLSFILSAYSYNSFRIIVPMTILILTIYNLRNFSKKDLQFIVISIIVLAISIIPIYRLYKYDAGASRLQAVGATSSDFFKNYLSHFSYNFLIVQGDENLRSQQTNFGQLYLPELVLLMLGIFSVVRSKLKYKFLLLILLLLGPLPAAITKESPHALRSLSMIPFIAMISAIGASYFKKYLLIIILIFLAFFINYFVNFLHVYPVQSSADWQFVYKKIFTDPKLQLQKTDRILISDKEGQPYIFALFYLTYDPGKFRAEVVRNRVDKWGASTVKSFGIFEFGDIKN